MIDLNLIDKQFEKLNNNSGYISTVFDDFLDFFIQQFSLKQDAEKMKRLNERYGFENLLNMLRVIVTEQNRIIGDEWDWHDIFGTYYEYIAGKYKRSGLGQFFTPKAICDVSSKMTLPDETEKTLTINDPACGSGRTLLSGYVHLKGKAILFGEDLDPICVKMTTLNIAMHGGMGEVICHNSLMPESFNFGYQIDRKNGFPYIRTINKNESIIVSKAKRKLNTIKIKKHQQLKLF